jgi:splicing factor 3A subunit 2
VTKSRDVTQRRALAFEVDYPEADSGAQPRHRFMSAYEQRVEAPDKQYQYLLFACEPYETIGFKVPNAEVDKDPAQFFSNWDSETRKFTLTLVFVDESPENARTEPSRGGAPKRQRSDHYDARS